MRIEIKKEDVKNAGALIIAIATNDAVRKLEVVDSDHNGTGYFNGLAARKLDSGLWGFECRGRHGVVAATPVGNIVMFERYAGNQGVVVCNIARNLRPVASMLGMSSAISIEQIVSVLDDLGGHRDWILDTVRTNVSSLVESVLSPVGDEENED